MIWRQTQFSLVITNCRTALNGINSVQVNYGLVKFAMFMTNCERTVDFIADVRPELLPKTAKAYSEKQRQFALTLHLHGPKAYSYLRDIVHLPLPHPHTLQRYHCF